MFCRSDVEEGGETVFPSAKFNSSSLPHYNELSDCAKQGLSVKPRMGDALLFWSMKPDGTQDPTSLHGEVYASSKGLVLSLFAPSSLTWFSCLKAFSVKNGAIDLLCWMVLILNG